MNLADTWREFFPTGRARATMPAREGTRHADTHVAHERHAWDGRERRKRRRVTVRDRLSDR